MLSSARSSALMDGRRCGDPGTCTGLSLKLTLNAEANSLVACRRVLATIGRERDPVGLPSGFQLEVR
jgi:hypothetical protein